MPINIFEYLNFREFLKDAYKTEHANNWRFSHRYIAEIGRFDATLFNKILQGKRNLTGRFVSVFADIFCKEPKEKSYFMDMVAFNQAKNYTEQRKFLERLMAAKECRVEVAGFFQQKILVR